MLLEAFGSYILLGCAALILAPGPARSLTVSFKPKGTPSDYVLLDHSAHLTIRALTLPLPLMIKHAHSEVVTVLSGAGFIEASFVWTVRPNRFETEREAASVQVG